MNTRLDDILNRRQELTSLLADPDTTSDNKRFTQLSREYAEIEPVAAIAKQLLDVQSQIQGNRELIEDAACDAELRELAQAELEELQDQDEKLEQELKVLLLIFIHAFHVAPG